MDLKSIALSHLALGTLLATQLATAGVIPREPAVVTVTDITTHTVYATDMLTTVPYIKTTFSYSPEISSVSVAPGINPINAKLRYPDTFPVRNVHAAWLDQHDIFNSVHSTYLKLELEHDQLLPHSPCSGAHVIEVRTDKLEYLQLLAHSACAGPYDIPAVINKFDAQQADEQRNSDTPAPARRAKRE
ncbi:hypothetical protein B0A55_08220 [Friedmanniomyces simplex]|uniref:Uncharacterized protein n=1 Tax=Friedmanniomyces simplex TaxID=329884 RepID=A0A4U0X418_9PEZI|nr:hypothetical protein B0A55_08220 [Friedmanniomyces simplex]